MTNKKVKLTTNINGVHGDNDIVSMWKQHYAAIFNSVENSSCAVIKLTVISVTRTSPLTMV